MNDSQQTALKLFIVMNRMMKHVTKEVEENIKPHGIPLTEFSVLELLHSKGAQPIQKIAQKVLLASGSTTYVVDKLEKKGLLTRKFCDQDSRVRYAELTAEGKQLMEAITPDHYQFIESLFEKISYDDQKKMIELMKLIGKAQND